MRVPHGGRGCGRGDVGRGVLEVAFADGRFMRDLRNGLRVVLQMVGAEMSGVGRLAGVRALRRVVRRVGNELVLSRGWIVGGALA